MTNPHKNRRHRGQEEKESPLPLKLESVPEEGELVIGAEERDQGDHRSAEGLDQSGGIKAERLKGAGGELQALKPEAPRSWPIRGGVLKRI